MKNPDYFTRPIRHSRDSHNYGNHRLRELPASARPMPWRVAVPLASLVMLWLFAMLFMEG